MVRAAAGQSVPPAHVKQSTFEGSSSGLPLRLDRHPRAVPAAGTPSPFACRPYLGLPSGCRALSSLCAGRGLISVQGQFPTTTRHSSGLTQSRGSLFWRHGDLGREGTGTELATSMLWRRRAKGCSLCSRCVRFGDGGPERIQCVG